MMGHIISSCGTPTHMAQQGAGGGQEEQADGDGDDQYVTRHLSYSGHIHSALRL